MINAEGLRITGTGFWWPKEVIGRLNLGFARATTWADDSTGRATPTVLDGFRYDALHPSRDQVGPGERIAWLDRDPTGYSSQPYAQLAAIYRAEGTTGTLARSPSPPKTDGSDKDGGGEAGRAGPGAGCCGPPSATAIDPGSPCCGCWLSSPLAR